MVSLDKWDDSQIKIKILLKGFSGTGKTRLCVKIAGIVAKKGYYVLYLDGENGADRELKLLKQELNVEERSRIEYEEFKNYRQMADAIDKNIKEKGSKLKLIIIDPMKLVEIARLSARDLFLGIGSYPWGSGTREIKNKEAFDIMGYLYSVPNRMVLEFLNYIITCEQDIICTLRIPETKDNEYKYKNEYDGTFDFVYETLVETRGNFNIFKAFPKKRRGARIPDAMMIDDLLVEVFGIFREKYVPDKEKTDKVPEIEKVPVSILTPEVTAIDGNPKSDNA